MPVQQHVNQKKYCVFLKKIYKTKLSWVTAKKFQSHMERIRDRSSSRSSFVFLDVPRGAGGQSPHQPWDLLCRSHLYHIMQQSENTGTLLESLWQESVSPVSASPCPAQAVTLHRLWYFGHIYPHKPSQECFWGKKHITYVFFSLFLLLLHYGCYLLM